MAQVDFILDRVGGADILRNNPELIAMEHNAIDGLQGIIAAQFFLQFGVEGEFDLIQNTTDRTRVIIRAASKQTTAILKNNPGWLGQFVNSMKL